MARSPYHDKDNITLFCGDNCEVMLELPPASVDLVVTSPPYDDLRTYGGHSWDFYGVAWNLKRLLKSSRRRPSGRLNKFCKQIWRRERGTKPGLSARRNQPISGRLLGCATRH